MHGAHPLLFYEEVRELHYNKNRYLQPYFDMVRYDTSGGNVVDVFTVIELAHHLSKSEETIKRWIKSGKFPNAYLRSDKEGWRIPKRDVIEVAIPKPLVQLIQPEGDSKGLIKLAYEAVTLDTPNEETLNMLAYVGMKRTLEVLYLWRKSGNSSEMSSFIKQAITEGWSTSSQTNEMKWQPGKNFFL